jgi:hypothetical protein
MNEKEFVQHFLIQQPIWDKDQIRQRIKLAQALFNEIERQLNYEPETIAQQVHEALKIVNQEAVQPKLPELKRRKRKTTDESSS